MRPVIRLVYALFYSSGGAARPLRSAAYWPGCGKHLRVLEPLSKKTAPPLVVVVLLLALVSFSGCANHDRPTPHFSEDIVEQLDSDVAFSIKYDNLPGVVVGVWVPGQGEYV